MDIESTTITADADRRAGAAVRNRILFALDLVGWTVIPFLALGLRLDQLQSAEQYLPHLLALVAIAIPCKVMALRFTGLYRRYWRYASVDELGLIVTAVLGAGLVCATLYLVLAAPFLPFEPVLPASVLVIDALLTLLYVGGTRYSIRWMEHVRRRGHGSAARYRVLVIGAGNAGMMITRELRANPQLEMEVVGFIDDNPAKHGNAIQGVEVLGGRNKIAEAARSCGADKAIIAMPTATGAVIREIRDICKSARLSTKTIPGVFEILSGRVSVTQLRDVQIEDLLRRKPVQTDQRAVAELVDGMTVLVTGAGGSIGSEICRQVAALGAEELVLLGHGENSIFEIHHELMSKHPGLTVVPVIADARNAGRIERVFETYRPQAVFHAAAHKHVPLMELNPEEAVSNNVEGTRNVVAASELIGVDHFVLISTDKAVNPANVMGATKLLGEMLVHDAAIRTGVPYVSVRFGNVLASSGSVVPLFQKQIAAGGPITVTHPDITRYFMTIPEAVQLVLQAAAMGRGGETFILDMGEPVRIVDLARDLVQLSGYEVNRDVEIVFSGLRPGEKLSEELYTTGEDVAATEHEKIVVVRNGQQQTVTGSRLSELLDAAQGGDGLRIRHLLAELLPGCSAIGGSEKEVKAASSTEARASGGQRARPV